MRPSRFLALPILLAPLARPGAAQDVGSTIPEIQLEGYHQTKATSFEDFFGRAVLIEFFAYW
ncbi:MAG: hypothetical protein AB1726_09650 [Planctomycetota bacterium]